jgi:hypothetical protein
MAMRTRLSRAWPSREIARLHKLALVMHGPAVVRPRADAKACWIGARPPVAAPVSGPRRKPIKVALAVAVVPEMQLVASAALAVQVVTLLAAMQVVLAGPVVSAVTLLPAVRAVLVVQVVTLLPAVRVVLPVPVVKLLAAIRVVSAVLVASAALLVRLRPERRAMSMLALPRTAAFR